MKSIILPIKPKYVKLILEEKKKYEFRKRPCKSFVKKIYIYETAPTKLVVGEAIVEEILQGTPSEIWNKCNEYGGIEQKDYDKYFANCEKAIAYKISEVKKYGEPKKLIDYGVNYFPQSFVYVE